MSRTVSAERNSGHQWLLQVSLGDGVQDRPQRRRREQTASRAPPHTNAAGTVSGSFFASEFLAESVRELPQWEEAREDLTARIAARLRDIRGAFPAREDSNEAVTKDELIWNVLDALGLTSKVRHGLPTLTGIS